MIKHIEKFHLEELSDKGFENLCAYALKKGLFAKELLPAYDHPEFRLRVMHELQGRLLLTIGDLLEYIDERVPAGPYNIKRNASRDGWWFDHEEIELDNDRPVELISTLWTITKSYLQPESGVSEHE